MAENENRVFIPNLAPTVTEEMIREFFKKHGFDIGGVKLPKDKDTGKVRGFAIVEMKSDVEMFRAVQNLAGLPFAGKDLRLEKARPSIYEQQRRQANTNNTANNNPPVEQKKPDPQVKKFKCPHCGGEIEIVRKPFNKSRGYNSSNHKKNNQPANT